MTAPRPTHRARPGTALAVVLLAAAAFWAVVVGAWVAAAWVAG